ncbi:unnamed protein product [Prunus brigantina]
MEEHKHRYLNYFLDRTKVVELEDYFTKIKERKDALRHYYEDTNEFDIADFMNMILVDAAFVIELLLRNSEEELDDDNDWIFTKPWMLQNILPDMLMLENQLPFFILEDLYNLPKRITGAETRRKPSIIKLSYKFFQKALRLEENLENSPEFNDYFLSSKPLHFVDFIRTLHLQYLQTGGPLNSTQKKK